MSVTDPLPTDLGESPGSGLQEAPRPLLHPPWGSGPSGWGGWSGAPAAG